MNKLRKFKGLPVILAVLIIPILACSSFVATSYQTLGTTATIVEDARQVYNDYYNQGKITPDVDAEVQKAYAAYQASMNTAIDAVKLYQAGGSTDTTKINTVLSDVANLVNTLLDLFTKAGVPALQHVQIKENLTKK